MTNKFSIKNIKAIVGLGNPGSKYCKNRHNIGFRVLDRLAEQLGGRWQSVDKMEYTTVLIADQQMYLIKPQTFMNDSGKVLGWLIKKGIKPDQIIVVHDELEKNFGQVLLKFGGSHKGHNGLRSIMGVVGADFWRLKFGIGRPAEREEVPHYVLSDFSRQEEAEIESLVGQAVQLLVKD